MPSRWDAATHGWSRRVFHYPLPTLMSRNFRLPCTIELQPLSFTPLKMRKVEPASSAHRRRSTGASRPFPRLEHVNGNPTHWLKRPGTRRVRRVKSASYGPSNAARRTRYFHPQKRAWAVQALEFRTLPEQSPTATDQRDGRRHFSRSTAFPQTAPCSTVFSRPKGSSAQAAETCPDAVSARNYAIPW